MIDNITKKYIIIFSPEFNEVINNDLLSSFIQLINLPNSIEYLELSINYNQKNIKYTKKLKRD